MSLRHRLETLRFKIFQRHRHRKLVVEHIAGHPLLILPDVFNPALFRSTEVFVEAVAAAIPSGARVLDLGCGSGIAGIVAASRASLVVAVDVNPEAVRCTQINALLNGFEDRIDVRQGDLFEPIRDDLFDVVLFNPPYFKGEAKDMWERALYGGDVAERFAAELPRRRVAFHQDRHVVPGPRIGQGVRLGVQNALQGGDEHPLCKVSPGGLPKA